MSVYGRHNSAEGVRAKAALREAALSMVSNPRVLEVFCGPHGEMYHKVWHKADEYTGVDLVWHLGDKRRRYAADALVTLRSADLHGFNIFDVDAFGAPWAEVAIVAARRRWAPGERGVFVVTDGSWRRARMGPERDAWYRYMIRMAGAPSMRPETLDQWRAVQTAALKGIARACGCRLVSAQQSGKIKTGKGGSFMFYGLAVIEGV